MITLIDSNGKEVDSSPYRERLRVPASKQDEIREWVAQAETELHNDDSPKRFQKRLGEFLGRATYTQNVLHTPYPFLEEMMRLLGEYTECLLPTSADFHETVNDKTYHLEKMIRLGIPLELSPPEREIIFKTENFYCNSGRQLNALRVIKMLGRHTILGLPDAEPERKSYLQSFLTDHSSVFATDWVGCSALRAGFSLPPCPAEGIERNIRGLVEQQEPEFDTVVRFGYRIFDNPVLEKLKKDSDFTLGLYVNGVHHLKRLFGEG